MPLFLYHPRVGELLLDLPRDEDIVGAPLRNLPPLVATKKLRFGTVGTGMDLPRMVWSGETQIFSSQDTDMSEALGGRPKKKEVRKWDQLPTSFLRKNGVDVLLIDSTGTQETRGSTLPMIEATPKSLRPKAIVVVGPSKWTLNLASCSWRRERRKRLEKLGYLSLEWFMSAEQQGSALQQERLVEVFVIPGEGRAIPDPPPAQGLPARPMRNLLLPLHQIPPRSRAPPKAILQLPSPSPEPGGLQVVGWVHDQPLYSSDGVMPDCVGAWIMDTDTGVHRLQTEELAKGKGLPSEWRSKDVPLPDEAIKEATCLHIWTAVCDTLGFWLKQPQGGASAPPEQWKHQRPP